MATKKVDNTIYDEYGERWYSAYDDPIALLRAENEIKAPWIVEKIQGQGMLHPRILDVGCGGGFLSNALARANFDVTGVDLSPESLKVAALHDETKSVKYEVADAYHLPYADGTFDVVTAMDFLEHVEHPEKVIQEFSRVLKPEGLFFFHTFNRNPVAWLVVIKMVEWMVNNTPKDMHVLRLFIRPRELQSYSEKNGMKVLEMTGIKPVLSSIPLTKLFSGSVPKEMRFELTKCLLLSYLGVAKKTTLELS